MLNNTAFKLKNGEKLTIGYFGGSITEGAGASDSSKCWRSIVTEWFRKEYPSCKIEEINAAIGGTGSDLGVYRCERDLLSFSPDLVFFEFSCNDFEDSFLPILNNCESIFLKIWKKNPLCDIVVVYTMTEEMDRHISNGKMVESRSAHSAAARYYKNVMEIDAGSVLAKATLKNGGDWYTYTVDTVHPNDKGYELYANTVIKCLCEELCGTCTEPVSEVLPNPLFKDNSYVGAHLVDASKASFSKEWSFCTESLCERYPNYYEANKAGAELSFEFSGIRIGLYWMMAKDSGNIEYSIDGSEWETVSSWDEYCKNFNRAHRMMLGGDLERGKHCLRLRVSSKKEEESLGYAVRIGAFLVCD